jgi:hypothetical protein
MAPAPCLRGRFLPPFIGKRATLAHPCPKSQVSPSKSVFFFLPPPSVSSCSLLPHAIYLSRAALLPCWLDCWLSVIVLFPCPRLESLESPFESPVLSLSTFVSPTLSLPSLRQELPHVWQRSEAGYSHCPVYIIVNIRSHCRRCSYFSTARAQAPSIGSAALLFTVHSTRASITSTSRLQDRRRPRILV